MRNNLAIFGRSALEEDYNERSYQSWTVSIDAVVQSRYVLLGPKRRHPDFLADQRIHVCMGLEIVRHHSLYAKASKGRLWPYIGLGRVFGPCADMTRRL